MDVVFSSMLLAMQALCERTDVFSAWKWPDTPGLHSFQGKLFHTAAYPEGLSLKDQKVAVIGSGSSGVQVVASIQDDVSQLYTWVRSAVWITAAFGQSFAGKDGRNFDCKLSVQSVRLLVLTGNRLF